MRKGIITLSDFFKIMLAVILGREFLHVNGVVTVIAVIFMLLIIAGRELGGKTDDKRK